MTEPNVKLPGGWKWEQQGDGTWSARCHRLALAVNYEADGVIWSTRDDAPVGIVLAVIAANAPDVLREFVAGLATSVPDGECPRHYRVEESSAVRADWYAAVDGDVRWEHCGSLGEMVAKCHEHRDAVAADCFPEMAARIAELEREVAAMRETPPVAVTRDESMPTPADEATIRADERRACSDMVRRIAADGLLSRSERDHHVIAAVLGDTLLVCLEPTTEIDEAAEAMR